jgi:hypothetical protein
MDKLLRFHGYSLAPVALPLLLALLVCGVLLLISIIRPRRRGWIVEVLTIIAMITTAILWQRLFYPAQRALVSTEPAAGCPIVEPGTPAANLRNKLGEPDRILAEDETRGPGATVWVYNDSRCAVHLLQDKVEYAE